MLKNLLGCLRDYDRLSKADQRLIDFLVFVWSYVTALGIIAGWLIVLRLVK